MSRCVSDSGRRSGCLSTASVAEATRSRSPGVSSAAFRAQSPDLRFAPLMDMDFAVRCPLVQRWRLISGFCPSTRTFAPCFFQTPPRGGSPCIITRPSPPSGWPEDFHLQTAEHAQHTTTPPSGFVSSCTVKTDARPGSAVRKKSCSSRVQASIVRTSRAAFSSACSTSLHRDRRQ